MKEKIVCAAIYYADFPKAFLLPVNLNSGVVVSGLNHAQIIHIMLSLTGKKQYQCQPYEQGFITTLNRFVDRIEGLEIATREKQIAHKHGNPGTLFSEDLYATID